MPLSLPPRLAEFQSALHQESDRGCALIVAAFLDTELEDLLRVKLVRDAKVLDELLGQSRPVATFSARIDLAYLAGLIPLNAHRELHLIRRIRHDFAHSPVATTFETSGVASRCSQLHCQLYEGLPPRTSLEHSAFLLLGTIEHAREHMVQFQPPPPIDLISIKSIGKKLQTLKRSLVSKSGTPGKAGGLVLLAPQRGKKLESPEGDITRPV
jgi:DNA-binding MltR family transcriptional regulator